MKNKILIIVTFLALLLPVKVFADTIEINQTNLESTTGITVESDKYTFATGEYKLTSNLDLGGHTLYIDGTNVTIDLNGFDITSTANDTIYIQSNSTVLLKGQGNINNESTDPYAYKYTLRTRSLGTNMSLTIDGPTILKQVYALANMNGLDNLHFHIKSGTFIGSIITRNVEMIIDDIDINHLDIINGNVTINDGYFHSGDNFAVIYDPDNENSTLTINDGRFISTYSGGVFLKPVGLTIKKGVF